MRHYYSRHPDEPAGFVLQSAEPGHTGPAFCLVRGTNSLEKPLDILVEKTSAGYRIDWRFITGSGEMDWAQWLETRPQSPVVLRAEAFAGSYDAPPFADPEKYLSLRLTDFHDQHTVWAYVDRECTTGVDLVQSLKTNPRLRITVELAFPPQTTAMQPATLLRAILPDGWKDSTLTLREI